MTRLRAALLVVAAALAIGCEPGAAPIIPLAAPPAEQGPAVEPIVDAPKFNPDEVADSIERARRSLTALASTIAEREPIALDLAAFPERFAERTQSALKASKRAWSAITTTPAVEIARQSAPLFWILALFFALAAGDRAALRLFGAAIAFPSPRASRGGAWLTRALSFAALRGAPPLVIAALSALADWGAPSPGWSGLAARALLTIAAARATQALAEAVSLFVYRHAPAPEVESLARFIARAAGYVAVSWWALYAIEWAGLGPSIDEAAEILVGLSWAIIPALLWRHRAAAPAALALFDAGPAPDREATLRRIFWLLAFSALVILAGTLGYESGARFVLSRTWGVVAIVVATGAAVRRWRDYVDRSKRDPSVDRAQAELLGGARWLGSSAIYLLGLSLALNITELDDPIIALLSTPLVHIGPVEFSLYNALSAAIIVGGAALLSKLLRAALTSKVYPAYQVDVGVAYAINTLVGYLIVVAGFFFVLVALGVNLAALTVVVASLSVGIGFGLQTLTENMISGMIILFGRAVRKGDFVTVGGTYGRIEAVGARSVVVRTPDNYDILIPSKEIVGGTIINWTYRDSMARLRVPVGVSYGSDPGQVRQALLRAAQRSPVVLKQPAPEVWLRGFGDSSIDFELLVYFDCRHAAPDRVRGELNYEIWDALQDEAIEIPFPQRDLHLRSIDPELGAILGRSEDDAPP